MHAHDEGYVKTETISFRQLVPSLDMIQDAGKVTIRRTFYSQMSRSVTTELIVEVNVFIFLH